VVRYDSPTLHALTLNQLSDVNSIAPGVLDGKTANAWFAAALKLFQIESVKAPTIADLDKPWFVWWHYDYDMPNLKAVVWKYERSPVSNDVFPPLNSMGQIDIALTPTDLTNGNKQIELPQGATFEYIVTRSGGAINQLTFAAGTFSGASSYYMDAAKTVLSTGARSHSFASTQVAAGLGIIADAPSNAKFVRYEFQYVSGGKLTYDFAI
jgi:hypothetical protein